MDYVLSYLSANIDIYDDNIVYNFGYFIVHNISQYCCPYYWHILHIVHIA